MEGETFSLQTTDHLLIRERSEQALRTAMWYNTFAGIFGGILSYASKYCGSHLERLTSVVGQISGKLAVWRYIFIIYGSVTVVLGIVVTALLPNHPGSAWFLNVSPGYVLLLSLTGRAASNVLAQPRERIRASARLAENRQGQDVRKFDYRQCLEAIKQPRYWVVMYVASFIGPSLPRY